MKDLQALQHKFLQDIIGRDTSDDNYVLPSKTLSSSARLNLYRDAYRIRLEDALSESYSALHTIAGDEVFYSICHQYINQFPSRHFSIRFFGENLADFIKKEELLENAELFSELALFEWSLGKAFDGENADLLSREQLLGVDASDWPTLEFSLLPTFNRLKLHWNVPQLWKAASEEGQPIAPQRLVQPTEWILWRPELQTSFRSVDKDESFALEKIAKKLPFAEFCQALSIQGDEEADLQAAQYIGRWLEDQLLQSF